MLTEIDYIPEQLLQTPADKLHEILSGPTLIHLDGKRRQPLFVSVLLHGNEYSGWEAIRRVLLQHYNNELPRCLSVFIGNIHAARHARRHLDDQPDYNRVWNGFDSTEHKMMQSIQESMKLRKVFASIDVHNNTGKNPHYACINKTDNRFLQLARMFSSTVVYFIRPDGVQSKAFAAVCPAVTLECGQPGEADGIEHAIHFINLCLLLDEIPDTPVDTADINIFHTIATVKVRQGCSLGITGEVADLVLHESIEDMNMKVITTGAVFADTTIDGVLPIIVIDHLGNDIAAEYFRVEAGRLVNYKPVIPSMLTLKKEIILDDCLCYLMEEYQVLSPKNKK